jgi:hypothetical protein
MVVEDVMESLSGTHLVAWFFCPQLSYAAHIFGVVVSWHPPAHPVCTRLSSKSTGDLDCLAQDQP